MIVVKGKTLDNDGYLPLVNIVEVGTKNSTQSDLNGNFTINVASTASKLRFSFVGYAPTELTASEVVAQKFITMAIDSELLDEVVITGGPKPKKDNTLLWIGIAAVVFIGTMVLKSNAKTPAKAKLGKPKKRGKKNKTVIVEI